MVHLIHRKRVPLLHNTVLILCDERDGLVARVVGWMESASLEANFWRGSGPHLILLFSLPLSGERSDMTVILLTGTLSLYPWWPHADLQNNHMCHCISHIP